jgi:hypothetical protein
VLALVGGGGSGVTFWRGVVGPVALDAAFDELVLDDSEEAVEDAGFSGDWSEFELVAVALATTGFAGAGFVDGLESLTDLSPGLDFPLFADTDAGRGRTGEGATGASSGIEGAVAGTATGAVGGVVAGSAKGSSARRIPPKQATRTSARPPARAERLARDVRTVDASTGKKSIEFGPAISDALRNTSRLGKFTKRRHGRDGILRRKEAQPKTLRASTESGNVELKGVEAGSGAEDLERAYKYSPSEKLSRWPVDCARPAAKQRTA